MALETNYNVSELTVSKVQTRKSFITSKARGILSSQTQVGNSFSSVIYWYDGNDFETFEDKLKINFVTLLVTRET